MKTYDIRFERSEEIAEKTMAFHFKKPEGFNFKPGQAVDLVLVDPKSTDVEVGRHTFSLVSAPYQGELVIATRMRDTAYKRALASLSSGAAAKLEGPFGSLTLHSDSTRPAIFIAGGIGITPFMSILRQAGKDLQARIFILIYSNRRPQDAAFLNELQQLESRNKHFTLVATMTKMEESDLPWDGHTGAINEALITDVTKGKLAPVYYVAGPPGMVAAMKDALNSIGISDDDIRSEEFFGY